MPVFNPGQGPLLEREIATQAIDLKMQLKWSHQYKDFDIAFQKIETGASIENVLFDTIEFEYDC